jgi:hypothetical protein
MSTLSGPKRLMLCSAFALAVSAAPAAAFATPSAPLVAACPAGESEDLYTDNCIPELSPNVPSGSFPTAGVTPDYPGQLTESTPGDPDSVPEIDGVPCTGGRSSGACIGLEEDAVPPVVPHSTLSSSP